MDFNDHPLWKFSLAVYGAPGVSAACLELQERRGADVNLLLYAAYVGASGRGRLDAGALAACRDAVRPWVEAAVLPLRAVRRALKADLGAVSVADAAALRQRIAGIEIAAEQLEQQALAARLPPVSERSTSERIDDAMANLRACLALYLAPDRVRDDAALTTVVGALPQSM